MNRGRIVAVLLIVIVAAIGALSLLGSFDALIDRQERAPLKSKVSAEPPTATIIAPGPPVGRDRVLTASTQTPAGAPAPLRTALNIKAPMTYGDFVWNDAKVPEGPLWIRVDLGAQIISVFRGGHEIGTSVVLYGADKKPTPIGNFPVMAMMKDHRSSLYDAPMPYTLRLTGDGVAIHGSNVRWGAATHGCIGVPKDFAAKLFEVAKVGDRVTIVAASPRAG